MADPRVIALNMGEFTFAPGEEYEGQTGVVAYAIRHAGGVFLFDTGFGSGSREGESVARDQPAYRASVAKLKALHPRRALFGHDRRGWPD